MSGPAVGEALMAAVEATLQSDQLAAPTTRLFKGLVAAGWAGEEAAIAACVGVVTASVTAHLIEQQAGDQASTAPLTLLAGEEQSGG